MILVKIMQTKIKLFLLICIAIIFFNGNIGNSFSLNLMPYSVNSASTPTPAPTIDPYEGWANESRLPQNDFQGILGGILNWLLIVVGMTTIIGFIISGLIYLTSTGNDKKMELAKRSATYCLIGAIVALSGFVVLKLVTNMLSGLSDF
jgi:hypothetical protein